MSPTLISPVTDAVADEAKTWRPRPLDAPYPIVCPDCIPVKVRDSGTVRTKAVYLAIGINMDGKYPQGARRKRWGCGLPKPKAQSSTHRA